MTNYYAFDYAGLYFRIFSEMAKFQAPKYFFNSLSQEETSAGRTAAEEELFQWWW